MDNKYDRELRDYRDTKNKAEAYERRKAEAKPRNDVTLTELKISHHNHYIDHQNKLVKKEHKELINERGK